MKLLMTALVFALGFGFTAHAKGDAAARADRVEKRGEDRKAHLNEKAARVEERAKKRAEKLRAKAIRVDERHEKRAANIRVKAAKRAERKAASANRSTK